MRSLRSVWIELAREKHAGGLQDLVGSAQLRNLPAEGLYLLPLVAAQNVLAPTLIRFYLAHVFAQRLGCDAQVSPNMRDRAPRLEHQPRRALEQLLGILPHSWHDRRLLLPPGKPWLRSLRQTQDGSHRRIARRRLGLDSANSVRELQVECSARPTTRFLRVCLSIACVALTVCGGSGDPCGATGRFAARRSGA